MFRVEPAGHKHSPSKLFNHMRSLGHSLTALGHCCDQHELRGGSACSRGTLSDSLPCIVQSCKKSCDLVLADMGISTCGSYDCLNRLLHEGTSTARGVWGQDTESLQSESICAIFSRNFRFHVYIGNTLKIDSIAVTIMNKVKQFGILKFLHVLAVPTLEFLSWMPVPNHVCQLQLSLTYMICFRIHKHFEYGYDGYRYKLLCNLDL